MSDSEKQAKVFSENDIKTVGQIWRIYSEICEKKKQTPEIAYEEWVLRNVAEQKIREIEESDFEFLWHEYGEADDNTLTEGAKALKRLLWKAIETVAGKEIQKLKVEFEKDFEYLWEEYGIAKDEDLTKNAQVLKYLIHGAVERVGLKKLMELEEENKQLKAIQKEALKILNEMKNAGTAEAQRYYKRLCGVLRPQTACPIEASAPETPDPFAEKAQLKTETKK